jgi:hypothetical protein
VGVEAPPAVKHAPPETPHRFAVDVTVLKGSDKSRPLVGVVVGAGVARLCIECSVPTYAPIDLATVLISANNISAAEASGIENSRKRCI